MSNVRLNKNESLSPSLSLSISLSFSLSVMLLFTRDIILKRDKHVMTIEFSLVYTFNAPPKIFLFHTYVCLKVSYQDAGGVL